MPRRLYTRVYEAKATEQSGVPFGQRPLRYLKLQDVRLTRRGMLFGIGGLGLGLTVQRAARSSHSHSDHHDHIHPSGSEVADASSVVAGVIEAFDSPVRLVVVSRAGSKATVLLDNEAPLWRHGEAVNLDAFVPGDEVVSEGKWANGVFRSSFLGTMYRSIEGRVVSRSDDKLETEYGTVSLIEETYAFGNQRIAAKPLNEIAVGDAIYVRGWLDPVTREFVAARVGVKATGTE